MTPKSRSLTPDPRSLACWALVAVVIAGLIGPVRAASGREPVIVIPGVAGSELSAVEAFELSVDDGRGGVYRRAYPAGEKVWVNTWEAALPGADDYFDALKFHPDAVTPVAPALRVSGIYHPAYDDLINYLRRQGYEPGVDLWVFAYDWRRDVRDTAADLDALVTRALAAANGSADPATWRIRRADIVAHSMGGLVGRYYVSESARASRIDQLITLGSPQLGAAKFLKTLLYGEVFGPWFLGIGLNPEEIRDVVQNMPGGMQLLPSRAYYAYYDNSDAARLRPYVVDGDTRIGGALGYTETRQLLLNQGKNAPALALAEQLHDPFDGHWAFVVALPFVSGPSEQAPPGDDRSGGLNGVRWDALIGYGHPALGQIREYESACAVASSTAPPETWPTELCARRDELPVDGDGTVPLLSAAMGDPWRDDLIDTGARRWYVEREHTALVQRDYVLGVPVGDGPGLQWIGERLSEELATRVVGISQAPRRRLSGLWVSALGPVAAQARDTRGRVVGRERGTAEPAATTLPGARYERLPGSEFLFLPDGARIDLAAEQPGSLDLKLRWLAGGQVQRTALYLGVRLGERGRACLTAGEAASGAEPILEVDADGDGTYEMALQPAAVLDAGASFVTP